MKTLKFRGKAMGGDYVYGLPTFKKLQSGKVVPAIMTKASGLQRDVVPVDGRTLEQFIGTCADNELWDQVELEDD